MAELNDQTQKSIQRPVQKWVKNTKANILRNAPQNNRYLTLIRMTKDEKVLAIFKGLML